MAAAASKVEYLPPTFCTASTTAALRSEENHPRVVRQPKPSARQVLDKLAVLDEMRMTRATYSEELLLDQKGCGNNQHIEERGHHSHDKPDEETAQISGIVGRPVRKKTPSIKYPEAEFDLSSNRATVRDREA